MKKELKKNGHIVRRIRSLMRVIQDEEHKEQLKDMLMHYIRQKHELEHDLEYNLSGD